MHDILGLYEAFVPKHTHQYAQLGEAMRSAITTYKTEVEQRLFPTGKLRYFPPSPSDP